jgi:predicted metalloprotease with PDZ domain
MSVRRGLGAFALAALTLAQPCLADCALDYRFVLRQDAPPRGFDVTLRFAGAASGDTTLRATDEWGGVTDFHRAIHDVRADAQAAREVRHGAWKLTHAPGERLAVRYRVTNDVPDTQGVLDHRDFYRAMVGPTFFHAFGHALVIAPEHFAGDEPVETCIRFEGLAPEATFASSHGVGQAGGIASMQARISPDALSASLFVGGDFRVLRREIAGRPLYVALRGEWTFGDTQFLDASGTLIAAQRSFWNDYDFPRYLVTLIPNHRPRGSYGGTAVTDAFAMQASGDLAVPGPRFEHLLAHEHLHTWVPRRIGRMGEDEALRYWFSEGFTDYLTHRLLVRAGFWTLADYATAMNRVLREYAASPAAHAPNEQVARAFWSNENMQRVPYLRGELLALLWARRMEASGGRLEDVLRGLRLPREEPTERLAVERVAAALERALGAAPGADVARHVERGEAFAMDGAFLGPCFIGEAQVQPRFELGFDRESVSTHRVSGVVPGSAAEQAGLRDGMAIEGLSVVFGDATRDVTVKVRAGEASRTFTFRPVAAEPMQVSVFRPKDAAGADAACRRWMED